MRVIRLPVLLVLAGCNQLIGADRPTLLPDASVVAPSCATGWHTQTSIVIDNPGRELTDYQVAIPIASTSDLRFAIGGIGPLPQAAEPGLVWVAIPALPHGITELTAFTDNDAAPSWNASPFVDVLSNPSFEGNNGWTYQPPIGVAASFTLPSDVWASDGAMSFGIDHEVVADRDFTSTSSISQLVTFPEGSDWVVRFDLEIVAASHDGVNGTNDGTFSMTLGAGLQIIWQRSGNSGNITGTYLGEETAPIGPGTSPLTIMTRVERGNAPGYAKGFFDHLRVRKHAGPEPTIHVGSARPCD